MTNTKSTLPTKQANDPKAIAVNESKGVKPTTETKAAVSKASATKTPTASKSVVEPASAAPIAGKPPSVAPAVGAKVVPVAPAVGEAATKNEPPVIAASQPKATSTSSTKQVMPAASKEKNATASVVTAEIPKVEKPSPAKAEPTTPTPKKATESTVAKPAEASASVIVAEKEIATAASPEKPKATTPPVKKTKAKASDIKPVATDKAEVIVQVSEDEIHRMIELEAYFLAEKRNFQPGFEQEDWAAATAIVMARLQGS